jgi:hypothetical protein
MGNERSETQVSYLWQDGNNINKLGITLGKNLGVPEENSHGEFIIEHYWGYTKRSNVRTDEYKVEHPKWELFSTREPKIEVDFGKIYGDEFAFWSKQKPHSTLFARGSKIAVYKGKKL